MASEIADLYITLRTVTNPLKSGFTEASQSGESFMSKMGGVSGALSKVGGATVAAAIGVGVVSLKMAGDFQANMTKLVTSAGESSKAIKQVSNGVLDMAVQTGTSTKELANGLYMIESAGFHASDGLKVLKAAAQGARAEQAPLKDVANAVTSALKSYGLAASDAVTVTNQMVATVGHGKMTMQELAGSLATVLPIAANAGVTFNELGGAIATLTGHGTSAQEATQELANTIRNLQAPNNVAINEMAQLGLSSNDVSMNLGKRGLTGTLELLTQTVLQHMGPSGLVLYNAFNQSKAAANDANVMISKMPASLQTLAREYQNGKITALDWTKAVRGLPADQANLAKQFAVTENKAQGFNQQLKLGTPASKTYEAAIKAMTGGATGLSTTLMLSGGNMSTFKANVNAVADAAHKSGSNVKGWNEIQKTFNFQLSVLKEQSEKTAITLGTKLIPVVESVMHWAAKNTDTLKILAEVIAGLLTVAAATWATKTAVGFVKGIVDIGKGAVSAVKSVAAFAKGVAGASNAVMDGTKVAKEATAANKLGQMFNAIGGGAKTAAVQVASVTKNLVLQGAAAVKTAAAWVVQKVAVIASAVAEKAAAVAQWILNIAMDANPIGLIILAVMALIAVVILIVMHWKQVSKFFAGLWGDVKKIFWDAVHAIGDFITTMIKFYASIPRLAVKYFMELVHFVESLPGRLLKFLEALPKLAYQALMKIGYWIGYALGWYVKQWIEFPGRIWKIITFLWDTGYHLFVTGGTKVLNWVKALPGKIAAFFTGMWHQDVALIKMLWNDVYSWTVGTGQKVIAWVQALPGKIGKFFSDLWSSVTGWVSKTWSDLYARFVDGLNKTITWVSSLPGKVAKFFSDMWHNVTAWVSRMWSDVVSYFTALPGNALKGLSALPGMLGKLWNTLITDATNFGKWIIQGLINGLKGMFSSVWKTISDFAKSVASGFTKALGIGSPSKLFHSFGTYIGQGLVNGLKSMTGTVTDQAKALAHSAVAGFGSPTLQVATAGVAGPAAAGGQSKGMAVNTAALTVGRNQSTANAGGMAQPIVVNVDGKKLFQVIVPYAQQHKRRNSASSGTMLA